MLEETSKRPAVTRCVGQRSTESLQGGWIMNRFSQLGAFGMVCGLLTFLGLPQCGHAQEVSRKDLLKAFSQLQKNAKKAIDDSDLQVRSRSFPSGDAEVLVGDAGRYGPVDVPINGKPVPVKMMVKVWAMPVKDGRETGQAVHLEKYKWQRKERFYLYFESAVPVQIGLYQDYVGDRAPERRLPDGKHPESYKTLMPGRSQRLPVLLEMDDNLHDELMSIVAVVAGSQPELSINQPEKQKPEKQTPPKEEKVAVVTRARSHGEAMDTISRKCRAGNKRFRATSQFLDVSNQVADPGSQVISTNPDDVAIIAFGPETFGYIQLKLHKD
jgi:hypothetical protein